MMVDSTSQNELQNLAENHKVDSLPYSVSSVLSKTDVSVGDTLTYTVSISVETEAIIPVLPQSSVLAKGINQEGIKQVSSREISQGKTISKVEFIYELSISDTGNLTIPKLSFLLPAENGEGLTLQSESYSFRVESPLNPLPFLGGLFCALAIIGMAIWKRKRSEKKRKEFLKEQQFKDDLVNEMRLLKSRVAVANSREWLLDLERILNNYAKNYFSKKNFQTAVKSGEIQNAENLLLLFNEARYGGGNQDVFENRETWKLAVSIMNLNEEFKQIED